jgi:hypothetical protein
MGMRIAQKGRNEKVKKRKEERGNFALLRKKPYIIRKH